MQSSKVGKCILYSIVQWKVAGKMKRKAKQKLIHEADPQSRPVVIIVFAHVVRPSVPFPLLKTKQILNENYFRYWQDCGSGRVDH